MKQLMKKPLARFRGELAEKEAGGVRKSSTKAQDFLKFLYGIQGDRFGSSRGRGAFPTERCRLRKALLLVRNPHRDLAWVRICGIERAQSRQPFGRRGRRHSDSRNLQKISPRTMSRHSVFSLTTRTEACGPESHACQIAMPVPPRPSQIVTLMCHGTRRRPGHPLSSG